MKKIFVLLVCAMLLTGCADESGSVNNKSESQETSIEESTDFDMDALSYLIPEEDTP